MEQDLDNLFKDNAGIVQIYYMLQHMKLTDELFLKVHNKLAAKIIPTIFAPNSIINNGTSDAYYKGLIYELFINNFIYPTKEIFYNIVKYIDNIPPEQLKGVVSKEEYIDSKFKLIEKTKSFNIINTDKLLSLLTDKKDLCKYISYQILYGDCDITAIKKFKKKHDIKMDNEILKAYLRKTKLIETQNLKFFAKDGIVLDSETHVLLITRSTTLNKLKNYISILIPNMDDMEKKKLK